MQRTKSISLIHGYLLNKNLLIGDVLDFKVCGFGSDVVLLEEKGIKIVGYDQTFQVILLKI
ncbi:MAG: hypothetical protein H6627_01915 [Calditrichae bacterium]|nr:hypothetical protein [Calditrichia bacterium]